MKSSKFDIKPKVRPIRLNSGIQIYLASWKDPGTLMQTRNSPMRYIKYHSAMGYTIEDALSGLRSKYLQYSIRSAPVVPKMLQLEATSNLPWWKRLFRV